MESSSLVAAYYRSPDVRARLAEYCGGSHGDPATFTARHLAAYGGRFARHEHDGAPVRAPLSAFDRLLEEGADVCRSLADRRGTLVQLDVDYVHPADPAEPYRAPYACFARLEPVYRALRESFAAYGLDPVALITGRGYHFTMRVPARTPFHAALVAAGRPADTLRERALGSRAEARLTRAAAHDGAGRLLEYFAHVVMRKLQGRTEVPVGLADVAPPGRGPFVCLDLSAYGDPLEVRNARCGFSANQKAAQAHVADAPPFVIVLPRREATLLELLEAREDPRLAVELAARQSARIPDVLHAPGWVRDYRRSALGAFHAAFDDGPPEGGRPSREAVLAGGRLPSCIRMPLERPNPHLLMPVYLRAVTLGLWSRGLAPRAVADLVADTFQEDHGWGDQWERYDASTRARFYVRLFAGLAYGGLESVEAVTCSAQAARGACPGWGCGCELAPRFFPPLGGRDPLAPVGPRGAA
jgi:hypothetical protein